MRRTYYRFVLPGAQPGARPLPRWAIWLATAASLVVGVVLFLLAASLALILLPVALVAGAIAIWRIRKQMRAAGVDPDRPFERQGQNGPRAEIIDAEYRIIEPGDRSGR